MNKIATHDSITGEEGYGLSKLLTIFARTQKKSIIEQWEAGCRYFDLRVRYTRGGWYGAHGLWTSKNSFDSILWTLDNLSRTINEPCYVNITYEGFGNKNFTNMVDEWMSKYKNLILCDLNIKYGDKFKWLNLKNYNIPPGGAKDAFFPLNFSSWHTLIPIPILWKKIYGPNPEFNEEYYQFVDFL